MKKNITRSTGAKRDEITPSMFWHIYRGCPEKTFAQCRNKLIIVILFLFGLRINEIRAFNYTNWNSLEINGTTRIYQSKTNKWRDLVLPSQHKKLIGMCNRFMPSTLKTSSHFLVTSKQVDLNNKYVIQIINKILKVWGITYMANLKTHSFRIGLVSSLFRKQVYPTVIQDIIGHANFQTTLRYNRNITSLQEKKKALNSK